MKYELIPHTADMGIRLTNKTIKGLFNDAAFALFDILTDIKTVKSKFQRKIYVEAIDYDELLNEFLNKLLKEFTVENNLLSKVKVQCVRRQDAQLTTQNAQRKMLSAIIYGEPYDAKRHKIKTEIKAITFHNLFVKKVKFGYQAEVIFDV